MVARTTPVGTAVAGQQAPAATMNGAAGGWLGHAQATTNQTGITTTITDLTSLSQAVTVGTLRKVKISGDLYVTTSVPGDVALIRIMEGATQLNEGEFYLGVAAALRVHVQAIVNPSAGAHTYKLTMVRAAGSGSLSVTAGATLAADLLIEDIGPQ